MILKSEWKKISNYSSFSESILIWLKRAASIESVEWNVSKLAHKNMCYRWVSLFIISIEFFFDKISAKRISSERKGEKHLEN